MKHGDLAICAVCNQPIDYIGSAWRHTGGQRVGHAAVPAENDMLRWVRVVQELEREVARLEAERERLRLALARAIALLELVAPMRAREILELRKELENHDLR